MDVAEAPERSRPFGSATRSRSRRVRAARAKREELILVVDDEPAICDTMRQTLRHHGDRVLRAGNGIEGLTQYSPRQTDIRAMVTDLMMPVMDGVTLCRALRALFPRLPLLVSSGGRFGKAGTDALLAFEDMGIAHVLHKPHNADLLPRTLRDVFRTPAAPSSARADGSEWPPELRRHDCP